MRSYIVADYYQTGNSYANNHLFLTITFCRTVKVKH